MNTQCTGRQLILQGLDKRNIVIENTGAVNSSDGGLLLLGKLEQRFGIIKKLTTCFTDNREPYRIRHNVESLLTQRIFSLVQGYEDIVDHETLRNDPLLQYVCNRPGEQIAGKSTLNRMELGKEPDVLDKRYSRIGWDEGKIEALLSQIFLESFQEAPDEVILDFDATDIPLHGDQERKFFHGYYDHYCYLPLYVFCDDYPLICRLRPSNIDGCAGSAEILETLIHRIRARFPNTRIIFRGDSGFCRDAILNVADRLKVHYIVGLARNKRLVRAIGAQLQEAKRLYIETGVASRVFRHFTYRTKKSWSTSRDVIAKAEHMRRGSNPRFIVTNIPGCSRSLYKKYYCARGNMENRIKEQQLDLFATRTSTGWMSSNHLRLLFSAFAYIFYLLLKRLLPQESPYRKSMPSTLRLRMMKVATVIRFSKRRVLVRLPESFPYWDIWRRLVMSLA